MRRRLCLGFRNLIVENVNRNVLVPVIAEMLTLQLLLAGIISTIYSLVMMVVLIGLVKEGVESKFCSVTTVFFCFVAGVFVIAALIHPQVTIVIFISINYGRLTWESTKLSP
jgi:hypothetical protein